MPAYGSGRTAAPAFRQHRSDQKLFLSKLYIYAPIPCIQNLTGSSFSVLMGPLYRTLIAETGQIFVIRTGQYGFPICHAMIFPIHSASCSGVIAPT